MALSERLWIAGGAGLLGLLGTGLTAANYAAGEVPLFVWLMGAGSLALERGPSARLTGALDGEGTALVTGASSGIGVELARELGRRGATVILVARREERLHDLAVQIRQESRVRVEVIAVDLTAPDAVPGLYAELAERGLVAAPGTPPATTRREEVSRGTTWRAPTRRASWMKMQPWVEPCLG